MTMFIYAARCPGNRQQILNLAHSYALAAHLTHQAEDAIASEMAQDYQTSHHDHANTIPATTLATTAPVTHPITPNLRHPHRGRYYRLVQRNNNRAFHAGVRGRLSQKSVTRLLALYSHKCLKRGASANFTLDHIVPTCKSSKTKSQEQTRRECVDTSGQPNQSRQDDRPEKKGGNGQHEQ